MTEPEISFDELRPEDYAAAIRLWNATPGVRAAETREEFERILARNPGLSAAARATDRLVGAVLAAHDGRRGYLYHLAVHSDFRRRGLGRTLVERCLAGLKEAGIARCTIFLLVENVAGEAFWRDCGWRVRTDLKALAIDL